MSKNMNRENIKQRKMGKCKMEKKKEEEKLHALITLNQFTYKLPYTIT